MAMVKEGGMLAKRMPYSIDMVRELSPFVLVESMADISIGSLYGDFAFLRGHPTCRLGAQFYVEL